MKKHLKTTNKNSLNQAQKISSQTDMEFYQIDLVRLSNSKRNNLNKNKK